MQRGNTIKMVLSALFLASGILLPVLFHAVGWSGAIFLPMHIPVILCGFICGAGWGGIVGAFVVFLSSAITGMPILYPVAVYMACELATYGIVCGLLRYISNSIIVLIVAMIAGRLILGIVQFLLLSIGGQSFVFKTFVTGAFVTALPGIIIQIIVIPILMFSLRKTRLIPIGEKQ